MQRRCAAIAGASGLVGSHVLHKLLEDESYSRVLALVRRPLPVASAKLVQRVTSFDSLDTLDDLPLGALFLAIGTTIRKAGSQEAFRRVDFDYALRIAEAARRAGATSLAIVSSVDASARTSNFYLRVKGELEENLAGLSYPALHIFRPSFLLGDRAEERAGERFGVAIARVAQSLMLGRWSRYRPIEAETVAASMIHAVAAETPGRHLYHWREMTTASRR